MGDPSASFDDQIVSLLQNRRNCATSAHRSSLNCEEQRGSRIECLMLSLRACAISSEKTWGSDLSALIRILPKVESKKNCEWRGSSVRRLSLTS
jgi:hypothetical protein